MGIALSKQDAFTVTVFLKCTECHPTFFLHMKMLRIRKAMSNHSRLKMTTVL